MIDKVGEFYKKFDDAYNQFCNDIKQLLIYSQPSRTRYTRVYINRSYKCVLVLYVQCHTNHLVKILINCDKYSAEYQINIVDIYADDVTIFNAIESFTSVAGMRNYMCLIRESYGEEMMISKLKFK